MRDKAGAVAALVALSLALASCGGGGSDNFGLEAESARQINNEANSLHRKMLRDQKTLRLCTRLSHTAAHTAKESYLDAVVHGAKQITQRERQSMHSLKATVRCVREKLASLRSSTHRLRVLTRRMARISYMAKEEAGLVKKGG
jgi:hypothetical protein